MKRILSVILCLCLLSGLWACSKEPEEAPEASTAASTASPAANPNASQVLGQESVLTTPQVGEYVESVFLANVPNQRSALLLSVRSDGTVDYIFSEEPQVGTSYKGIEALEDTGRRYYTITPDGEATSQPLDWLSQLDAALAAGLENLYGGNISWTFDFSSCEGNILILARLGGEGRNLSTVVYRVKDNQLVQIPIPSTAILDGRKVSISLEGTGRIFTCRDCFLLTASDGTDVSFYSFSYDGVPLARQPMDTDGLFDLAAAGAETAWFTSLRRDCLQETSAADLAHLETYSIAYGHTICGAVAPDGSAAYLLRNTPEESRIWLSKVPHGGEEITVGGFNLYAFEDPTETPSCLAAANDGIFYTWTEGTEQGVLRQYRYNPQGAVEPEFRTVYSLERSRTVQAAVSLWNQTHSDITFRYIVGMEEIQDTSLTKEDAITRLNTQLVNGQGPDVLILDGLPVDSMVKKGFLSPLPNLDVTGVYPKLLERFTVDGSLYAVPSKMIPFLLGRKIQGTVDIDSLEAFADYVESATGPLDLSCSSDSLDRFRSAVYYIDYADQVFDLWYPAWCDAIWEGGRFHPEVYQALLTGTSRLVKHYSLDTVDQEKAPNPEDTLLQEENTTDKYDIRSVINQTENCSQFFGAYAYCLAATDYVGLLNFNPPTRYTGNNDPIPCKIVGIPGPDGTGATIPTCIAGVREGGDREAGLAFLRLLLSDEIQLLTGDARSLSTDGYPVKWSCTPILLEGTASRFATIFDQEVRPFQIENDFEAALSALRPVLLEDVTYNAAKEAALRYYEGKLTAQEAADQVAEATAIYLAEHRQ